MQIYKKISTYSLPPEKNSFLSFPMVFVDSFLLRHIDWKSVPLNPNLRQISICFEHIGRFRCFVLMHSRFLAATMKFFFI